MDLSISPPRSCLCFFRVGFACFRWSDVPRKARFHAELLGWIIITFGSYPKSVLKGTPTANPPLSSHHHPGWRGWAACSESPLFLILAGGVWDWGLWIAYERSSLRGWSGFSNTSQWEKGIGAWDDFNIETEDDIFIDTDFLICYFCMCVRPFKCVGGLRANDPLENVLPCGGGEEPNKSLHVCL